MRGALNEKAVCLQPLYRSRHKFCNRGVEERARRPTSCRPHKRSTTTTKVAKLMARSIIKNDFEVMTETRSRHCDNKHYYF